LNLCGAPMLSASQARVVRALSATTSAVSAVGAVSVVLSYFALQRGRSPSRRRLAILSGVDAALNLASLALLLPSERSEAACRLYTLTSSFLTPCSALWTVFTSLSVYREVSGGGWRFGEGGDAAAHALGWGLPAAGLATLLALPDTSDHEDIGCWIPRRPLRNALLRLAITYVVLWVAWVLNAVLYVATLLHGQAALQQRRERLAAEGLDSGGAEARVRAQFRLLTVVPVAYVLLRVWGSVNVVKDLTRPDAHWFAMDALEAVGDQAQGAVHGLVFVALQPATRRALRAWLARRRGGGGGGGETDTLLSGVSSSAA
jgi:hypothetical protein